jgi:putative endonuclease
MFFVYVLYSETASRRYVGMSSNPDSRLKQHNGGSTKSTKAYRPWTIVHIEEYKTLAEARNREKYLKSGIGREYLDKILHLYLSGAK